MIKKKCYVLIAILMISVKGFAQEKKSKFSVDPYQLGLLNVLNFEYERSFNDGELGVAFYYGNSGNVPGKLGDTRMNFSEQSIALKKYAKSFSTNSFWSGIQLSVTSGLVNEIDHYSGETWDVGTLGLSAKVGYQVIVKSFYLDVHAGLGYAITNKLFGEIYSYDEVSEERLLTPYGIKMGIIF